MKELSFFIKNYKYDLLTAALAIVLNIFTFSYYDEPRVVLITSLAITLSSVSLIIYLRLRDKDFYYIPLKNGTDKDDWIGRGTFEYRRSNNAYLITDSEPGFIYSKALTWSDYKYEFDFKIINACLGVVIRAVNLSDYLMFQIRQYGIRPHIRINGGWRPWEAEETGLTFSEELSPDVWYKGVITCEKELVNIVIFDGKRSLLSRSWEIPHERLGFPFPQRENDPQPLVIHFPINLDHGTVGFRNAGIEKALVRNVLIEKL